MVSIAFVSKEVAQWVVENLQRNLASCLKWQEVLEQCNG